MTTRVEAESLDTHDPLARFRDAFVIDDPELVYLDGNSLGRLPKRTIAAVGEAMTKGWGSGLVRSWHAWIDLAQRTGDVLAPLIGARAGETTVVDQTSVNLFKLADAALEHTGRTDIVTDTTNFPSDRYVLRSVAERRGGVLRILEPDPITGLAPSAVTAALDEEVGLVSLSHVGYKTGTISDMAGISSVTAQAGALSLWDLSHSVGAVPIDLTGSGADLAVGCTYKHLNGGPGAPAFLWVRAGLQTKLDQPIKGWFGHEDMFAFSDEFVPAHGVRRFAVGTPPILSLVAARAGIEVTSEAGIGPIRTKSTALTELLIERFDARLHGRGFSLASPREAIRRGAHVALRHPEGYRLTQAMIDRGVIPDFRAPDTIRMGVAPLYTRFVEVWDAIEILGSIYDDGAHVDLPGRRSGVT